MTDLPIVFIDDVLYIDSISLAECTASRHKSMVNRIKNIVKAPPNDIQQIYETEYTGANGRKYPCYLVDGETALKLLEGRIDPGFYRNIKIDFIIKTRMQSENNAPSDIQFTFNKDLSCLDPVV